MFPFNAGSKTFKIDVTATSSTSKAIESSATIRLVNTGYTPAYVSIGAGLQTATLPSATTAARTCDIVPAGGDITLSIQHLLTGTGLQIAAICDTGLTTTLVASTGDGI